MKNGKIIGKNSKNHREMIENYLEKLGKFLLFEIFGQNSNKGKKISRKKNCKFDKITKLNHKNKN